MRRIPIASVLAVVALAAAGCRGSADDEQRLVARAGTHVLSVERVVDMLDDVESLPASAQVVESLADLWIDYTLLAVEAATDSSFASLDLTPLVRRQLDQEMLAQFRDSVIQVDTTITEDELREAYESDAPGVRMRARHIMLRLPPDASDAQADSVRTRLEGLRERIEDGASFAALARSFSEDPGSAAAGGDLGFFAKGDMLPAFEEALAELDPGEVSQVVETPMGLHLIQLEERRAQGFDEVAGRLRSSEAMRRVAAAESTFVASVEQRVGTPRLAADALDVARTLAAQPGMRLSRRAADRAVLEWDGGALTAGELQGVLQFEQVPFLAQVANGADDELTTFLRSLARRDLLIAEARSAGLAPPRERVDSLTADAGRRLLDAARRVGLYPLDRAPGEPIERAVARAVGEGLRENLSGASPMVPLGPVGFQLRREVAWQVFPAGVGQAILQIGTLRAARGASPVEEALDAAAPAPDSTAP